MGLFGALALLLAHLRIRRIGRWERQIAFSALGTLALLAACYAWGELVEPNWLQVTHTQVESSALPSGYRFRIVQISDLHVDGANTRALTELPDLVNAQHPDLIVFTGDAVNSSAGIPTFRDRLSRMNAKFGRVAVRGDYDTAWFPGADLFGEGVADELVLDPKKIDGGRITLCGAPYGYGGMNLDRCLKANPDGFRIVVFHTPDWVVSLEQRKPDLYLCGHTHGGQVRLPFYGALVTQYARFGKRFEMGRYQVGATTLYVNRGIGFVSPPMPRVRFLCRPEVAVIDLIGTGPAGL